jgi:hypothetical protein
MAARVPPFRLRLLKPFQEFAMPRPAALPLILCVLLFAGCASQPGKPARLPLRGFSLAMPAEIRHERTWVVAQQTPERLILGKPGRFDGESFALQAFLVQLPPFRSDEALQQYAQTAQRREMDAARFRVVRHEVMPYDKGAGRCALSHLEVEDRGDTSATGPAVNMRLETLTLTYAHPQNAAAGINVAYLHRHFPEDRDPRFIETGTLLLKGLDYEANP